MYVKINTYLYIHFILLNIQILYTQYVFGNNCKYSYIE